MSSSNFNDAFSEDSNSDEDSYDEIEEGEKVTDLYASRFSDEIAEEIKEDEESSSDPDYVYGEDLYESSNPLDDEEEE